MRLRTAGALGGALSLSACAPVGPTYRGPPASAVLHAQSAAGPFVSAAEPVFTARPLSGAWWRLYDAPQLDALVREALAANTDLRVAAANLARAEAGIAEATALQQPTANLTASVGYGRTNLLPLPGGAVYDVGAGATLPLDVAGRLRRGVEAARADGEALQAAQDAARISVAAEVARAYATVCATGHELEVARRVVALLEDSLARTERLVSGGRASALDRTRSRAQLQQVRANIPPLQAQRRIALFRLATLRGRPPAEVPPEVEGCVVAPRLRAPLPTGDAAALLRRRPDVRQAERALAAATARIGVATADLYPSVSLGASVGSTGLFQSAASAQTWHWNLGPALTWTFPNRSLARARIAAASAAAEAALAQLDGAVLGALQETEAALTTYARDLERTAALRAARDEGAEAVREVNVLFLAGRESSLSVLDAERTLANTEAALAASETRLAQDEIALFLALGGGWEEAGAAAPAH